MKKPPRPYYNGDWVTVVRPRPLRFLSGICEIIDGIIKTVTLGAIITSLNYKCVVTMARRDGKKYYERPAD